jgi:hypothetical protein
MNSEWPCRLPENRMSKNYHALKAKNDNIVSPSQIVSPKYHPEISSPFKIAMSWGKNHSEPDTCRELSVRGAWFGLSGCFPTLLEELTYRGFDHRPIAARPT